MANGQQLAELNFQSFCTWLSSRTDEDLRQMVVRGGLSRKEIAAQCSFAVSALNQNPRINAALLEKEAELRTSGVLPPRAADSDNDSATITAPSSQVTIGAGRSVDVERLRRLELENASLKTENQAQKIHILAFPQWQVYFLLFFHISSMSCANNTFAEVILANSVVNAILQLY